MGSIIQNLTSSLDLLQYINPFNENFILNGVINSIGNVLDYLNPFSDHFILNGVLDYLNPFSDNFILNGVLNSISNVISYLNPFDDNFFGYGLIDLFKDLFTSLFIPNESSFQGIYDVFKDKISFVGVIQVYVEEIKVRLDNMNSGDFSNSPKIQFDVVSSYYSGSITIFDCAWIAPYKKYTDLFIAGFCYIGFLWRLYKRLPSIINGSGVFGRRDD